MKELKTEIIGAVQDSIDLTDNQVSIPTLNIMLDEILPEQLRLYFVSQQRELLLSAICQFTKRNTQKEIQEVEKWIETDFRK